MTRSSPTKPRYKMQPGTGSSSSPSPSTMDMVLSYSSSSMSTASTSIFPGIPKTPERDNKVHWVGQPLIPRRITAKKKKTKKSRSVNSGYISSDTSRDASIEQHHRSPHPSEVPIRLQPRFSAYQDEDGNLSTTSSLTWEKTKDCNDILVPSLDDKSWRPLDGEDKSASSSASSCGQKLYLKSNRKKGSPVLENILENQTSQHHLEHTLSHHMDAPQCNTTSVPRAARVPARVVEKKVKKHYRDDDMKNKVEESTSELDSGSFSKENIIYEQEESEEHEGKKQHKRGRRKGCRSTVSKEDTWSDLLSNMYNDSIDDIKRGCNADAITDFFVSCDVQSWFHHEGRHHDDILIYSKDAGAHYVYDNHMK